jgi:hypothetical protein
VFHEDPTSGEDVFTYPGLDVVGRWMVGSSGDATNLGFTGRTAGLNIALGQYLPGFGPVVQLPTSLLEPHIPVGWDWVQDMVLPFGAAETEFNPGMLMDIAMPAWWRRGLTAIGTGGEQYQRLHYNSVIDVFRIMSIENPKILDDPVLADAAMKEAAKRAVGVGLIRAFAQFIVPTGPQVQYTAGDRDGQQWYLQTLSSEYYRILALNDFDRFAALQEFDKRFGLDPSLFSTPKSVKSVERPTTTPGDVWYRQNEDLFDQSQFPTTAAYALPDAPWDDFSYNAYRRQLEDDARSGVTPEVWYQRRNQLVGALIYEHAKEAIVDDEGEVRQDNPARQWLRDVRISVMRDYPGFGLRDLPGLPGRATTEQQMLELERWAEDPRLWDSNAGKGMRVYLDIRQQAQQRSVEMGLQPDSFRSANKMLPIRNWMRESAQVIMQLYPDFGQLWFDVFATELEDDGAEEEPLTVAGVSFVRSGNA